MKFKTIVRIILILIVLTPGILWLVWLLSPRKKLVTDIIDKSVLSHEGQEHVSLDWVLHYEKFTKTNAGLSLKRIIQTTMNNMSGSE